MYDASFQDLPGCTQETANGEWMHAPPDHVLVELHEVVENTGLILPAGKGARSIGQITSVGYVTSDYHPGQMFESHLRVGQVVFFEPNDIGQHDTRYNTDGTHNPKWRRCIPTSDILGIYDSSIKTQPLDRQPQSSAGPTLAIAGPSDTAALAKLAGTITPKA